MQENLANQELEKPKKGLGMVVFPENNRPEAR